MFYLLFQMLYLVINIFFIISHILYHEMDNKHKYSFVSFLHHSLFCCFYYCFNYCFKNFIYEN